MSTLRLWAVIPAFNRRETTLACVRRLLAERLHGANLNIIVVDDGSSDGSGAALLALHESRLQVLTGDGNLWWSGAMNLGVSVAVQAGCDLLLCINDDTSFAPGLLAALLDEARAHPKALVAPQAVYEDSGELMQSGYDFVPGKGWTAAHAYRPLGAEPYEVQGLAGACVLIPSAVFHVCGLYAAGELPQYHADIDLSWRAERAGFHCRVLPAQKLRVTRNARYFDLLTGSYRLGQLKGLLRWPGGVYAPKAFFAFYRRTHPGGPWAGRWHAALFYVKAVLKILLNRLGLGSLFKARA